MLSSQSEEWQVILEPLERFDDVKETQAGALNRLHDRLEKNF